MVDDTTIQKVGAPFNSVKALMSMEPKCLLNPCREELRQF